MERRTTACVLTGPGISQVFGSTRRVAILSEAMATITVYSTDPCSFCSRAKELLQRRGYPYEEINLSKDPAGRAELVDMTGMFSFPQIVINGEVLGGFRELVQADMSGKLEELAAAAESAPGGGRPAASHVPTRAGVDACVIVLDVAGRPPFDGDGVLRWLGARLVPGVEEFSGGVYRRTLRLARGPGVAALEPRGDHVRVTLALTDPADRDAAVAACRALFDLDADPAAHTAVLAADPALAPSVAANPGLRAPGTVDRSETAVRAVLGQQISLAAARTLAGRLVEACGAPLPAPDGKLTHTFPAPDDVD